MRRGLKKSLNRVKPTLKNVDHLWEDPFLRRNLKPLLEYLDWQYEDRKIYPEPHNILRAYDYINPSNLKVVIVGQDPYHNGSADGLAFSIKKGSKKPPSLKNILKEANVEYHSGDLSSWAEQGVFLLNSVLTVEEGKPLSHQNIGWEEYTNYTISVLNQRDRVIWLLWGNKAQEKELYITNPTHVILKAPHPSPLSAKKGFFGCRHFEIVNEKLREWGKTEINWESELY